MIEEIAKHIYRIEVLFPISDLGFANSYVITDPDRNLIVDCGMAHMHCFEVMQSAVKELGWILREQTFSRHTITWIILALPPGS